MPKTSTRKKPDVALSQIAIEDKAKVISREFEDFAYIVSHDLNAPLRHIREFTHLLIASRPKVLSADEREYVDFLDVSLDKLSKMQDALLVFSRLNTQARDLQKIDCNAAVTLVLEGMSDEIARLKAQVHVYDLPVVTADPKQLYTLFANLIGNAIKFHDFEKPINATITAGQNKKEHIFKIVDNGIGIAPEYHEEIFRFFRRLNVSKFPGIGAGLSICKKIVQRYGGKIWIESEEGHGTAVYFTFPK